MGETFARNPATGFQSFVQELADLEGPALQGITLTPAEERRAGERAKAEYLARANQRGYKVVNDPARLKYLRDLVDTIAVRMPNRNRYPTLEVTLVDAPIPDGQSFPGGYLVFTTALLDEPDEATVVGVVAHELAHLDRGHLYELARRSKLAESTYTNQPGGNSSFDQFFTRGMALFGLMMNPFRPEHESEADCTATTWLYQEGYDPNGLVGFFERMHRRNNDQPANPFFSFGRTHPYSLDRRRDVLNAWHSSSDGGGETTWACFPITCSGWSPGKPERAVGRRSRRSLWTQALSTCHWHSRVIRRRRRRAAAAGPVGVEELAAGLVDPLVGVGPEDSRAGPGAGWRGGRSLR